MKLVRTTAQTMIPYLWVCVSAAAFAPHSHALHREDHIYFVKPASYQRRRPWQQYSPNYNNNNRVPPQSFRRDYSQHLLTHEEAIADHRTRPYSVDMARRRNLGKMSWTARLVFLNVAAFAVQSFFPTFTAWGIKRSDLILQGQQLYRLATPVFLHGGLGHLFTNMYSLNNVGPDVERLFGSGRFFGTYMLAGICGNLFSAYQTPNPALGASGAVFGILGAYAVFLMRHDWLLGRQGEDMSSRLLQTAVLNIGLGFVNPSIDNWGHIGGFVGGAAMAHFFGPRLYLKEKADGSGGRILVDRPIWRLPRVLEQVPDRLGQLAEQAGRTLRVDRWLPQGGSRPWQRRRRQPPLDNPRGSIKPDRS